MNNVGTSRVRGNAVELDLDEWDRGMKINLKSMVMMTRFAVPEMKKSGGGSIINIASITASTVAIPTSSTRRRRQPSSTFREPWQVSMASTGSA